MGGKRLGDRLQIVEQGPDVGTALGQRGEYLIEGADHLSDLGVERADSLGDGGRVVDELVDLVLVSLQGSQHALDKGIGLGRVDGRQKWAERVQKGAHPGVGDGLGQRDHATGPDVGSGRSRIQVEELLAEDVVLLKSGLGT
jgi:hypothetical protein